MKHYIINEITMVKHFATFQREWYCFKHYLAYTAQNSLESTFPQHTRETPSAIYGDQCDLSQKLDLRRDGEYDVSLAQCPGADPCVLFLSLIFFLRLVIH